MGGREGGSKREGGRKGARERKEEGGRKREGGRTRERRGREGEHTQGEERGRREKSKEEEKKKAICLCVCVCLCVWGGRETEFCRRKSTVLSQLCVVSCVCCVRVVWERENRRFPTLCHAIAVLSSRLYLQEHSL